MLRTLFISGLVLLPLVIAVVLIAYRARYFVLGIAAIVVLMMLIWAGLRIASMLDEGGAGRPAGPERAAAAEMNVPGAIARRPQGWL